ncbi:MAG: Uma2 family endonuclease, partial [Myxococcota bacterium]
MSSGKQGSYYMMADGGYRSGSSGGGMSTRGGSGSGMSNKPRTRLEEEADSLVWQEDLRPDEPIPPLISEQQLFSDWKLPLDTTFQLEGRYTHAQFLQLRERLEKLGRAIRRLELLDGEVFVSSSAREPHAVAIPNLMVSLSLTVRRQKLGTVYSDFALLLEPLTELLPDLIFASEADLARCGEKGIRGAAQLVVEVLSPSTGYLDRNRKKLKYLGSGVREYWLVDCQRQEVEVFTPVHLLDAQQRTLLKVGETISTPCIPRWSLPIEAIFDRAWVHEDPEAVEIAAALNAQIEAQKERVASMQMEREQMASQLSAEQAERERAHAEAVALASQLSAEQAERERMASQLSAE